MFGRCPEPSSRAASWRSWGDPDASFATAASAASPLITPTATEIVTSMPDPDGVPNAGAAFPIESMLSESLMPVIQSTPTLPLGLRV